MTKIYRSRKIRHYIQVESSRCGVLGLCHQGLDPVSMLFSLSDQWRQRPLVRDAYPLSHPALTTTVETFVVVGYGVVVFAVRSNQKTLHHQTNPMR